jgi:hypothetical protein
MAAVIAYCTHVPVTHNLCNSELGASLCASPYVLHTDRPLSRLPSRFLSFSQIAQTVILTVFLPHHCQVVWASANAVQVHRGSFGHIRWREEKPVVTIQ